MKIFKFLVYTLLFLYAIFIAKLLGIFIFDFSELFPEFPAKLFSIGAAVFLISVCVFSGQFLTSPFRRYFFDPGDKTSPVWKILTWAALGGGFISFTIFIWGSAVPGSLRPKLFLLTSLLLVVFFYGLFINRKNFRLNADMLKINLDFTEFVFLSASLAAIFLVFIACFSPITYYDSLVYHLGLPAYYLTQEKITVVPFNLYSLFPSNMEMIFLYLLGTFHSAEYIINLLCWSISLGVGMGLFQWIKEIDGRKTAFLAFFLWWTMPAVLFLSLGAYVDIALSFFVLLSLRTIELSKEKNWRASWLFISGLLSGLACATKYTGVICPIFIIFFLLLESFIDGKIKPARFFIFLSAALIPFSPWLIRNAVAVGNPIFPFGYQFFKGSVAWTKDSADSYFRLLTEYGAKSDLVREIFQAPWKIATNPMKFGGGFDVLGDFGWPLILLTAPLAIVLCRQNKKIWIMIYFFLFFAVFWFVSKPVLRFLIPALPFGVILSALAIQRLLEHKRTLIKFLTILWSAPWLIANFFFMFQISDELKPFSVSLGLTSKENFLKRKIPFYQTFEFANKNLLPFQKIFILGEQRGYHLKIPYFSANLFSKNPVAEICNGSPTSSLLETFFQKIGVTHILINNSELGRLGGLKAFGFDQKGEGIWSDYLGTKTTLLFSNNSVDLLQIKSN